MGASQLPLNLDNLEQTGLCQKTPDKSVVQKINKMKDPVGGNNIQRLLTCMLGALKKFSIFFHTIKMYEVKTRDKKSHRLLIWFQSDVDHCPPSVRPKSECKEWSTHPPPQA